LVRGIGDVPALDFNPGLDFWFSFFVESQN